MIRVLLADDHQIMREGLRVLLEREPEVEIVGEAETGRQAVELAQATRPDVAVVDISMPDLNGIDATRQILAVSSGTRVLALSMHHQPRYVSDMFKAGATGYLSKSGAFVELTQAIREVIGGRMYVSPGIAATVVEGYVRNVCGELPARPALSAREREVIQLLAEGLSSKQIAAKLDVSIKTIITHRQNIMEKLDIHNVAGLTKYALEEGLTSLEVYSS